MEFRWPQGLWMGKLRSSEEHVVCNLADGLIYRCRSVQPLPRNVTLEELKMINGRTWAPIGVKDVVVIKVDPAPARDLHLRDLEEQAAPVPRCV